MGIKHSLSFNGINTADYGVYISGEGVFDAPKRSVEMVSIPGRDGDLALDNGHFENIEVKYPAFVVAPDLDTFTDTMRELRNMFCSQKGYARLADSFNPNEYRLGIYKSGLEVDVVKYNTAASFELVFDCEPFRYLMSGESEIEVTSGSKIANPCPFESKPLIELEGYGTLNIGEYEIELSNVEIGDIELSSATSYIASRTQELSISTDIEIDTSLLNQGDTIRVNDNSRYPTSAYFYMDILFSSQYAFVSSSFTKDQYLSRLYHGVRRNVSNPDDVSVLCDPQLAPATFAYGVASTLTGTGTATYTFQKNSVQYTSTIAVTCELIYDGADKLTSRITRSISSDPEGIISFENTRSVRLTLPVITGYSTQTALGHPTYIDCDIGQAYKESDGELISLDAYIDLGSDLPILDVGETEITFDNTITSVKIIPRWRQI